MSLVQVRITKKGVAGMGRNALREVGRIAIAAAALHWWTKYLPIHFTKRATRRYKYKPRSGESGSGRRFRGSYTQKKLYRGQNQQGEKAIGVTNPLVFTGESRAVATSSPKIRAKAPNFREYTADVVLNVPRLNFVPTARQELLAFTPDEERDIERVFAAEYEAELNRRGRTKTSTIG